MILRCDFTLCIYESNGVCTHDGPQMSTTGCCQDAYYLEPPKDKISMYKEAVKWDLEKEMNKKE